MENKLFTEKEITRNHNKISYTIKKNNASKVAVFIHGFLEDQSVWNCFFKWLETDISIIVINLPGHKNSELELSNGSMASYTNAIYDVLVTENFKKTILIGHSMGGYVALDFCATYPEKVVGLCLFHSQPFADSKEKKKARTNTIENLKKGNKPIICKNHALSIFSKKNRLKLTTEIENAEKTALGISIQSIIFAIQAMQNRNDNSLLLKNFTNPFLYITGRNDQHIPVNLKDKILMPNDTEILILEKSGHIGFIEEPEKSAESLHLFLKKC